MKCPKCQKQCDCVDQAKEENPWQTVKELAPVITKDRSGILGEFDENHPAFAVISASRVQGSKGEFFGSGIKHNSFISVTISRAERNRDKYGEHVFEKDALIEVQMTTTQWAEFITTMNYGSGSPCTLHAMRTEEGYWPFPRIKLTGRQKEINDDLKRKTAQIAEKVMQNEKAIKAILNKTGAINKGDREELKSMMHMMNQDIKENLPFLGSCMQKSFDKIVHEAKVEIEDHLNNATTRAGQIALSKNSNDMFIGEDKPRKLKRIKK